MKPTKKLKEAYENSKKLVSFQCGYYRVRRGIDKNLAWDFPINRKLVDKKIKHESLSNQNVSDRIRKGWDYNEAHIVPKYKRGGDRRSIVFQLFKNSI